MKRRHPTATPESLRPRPAWPFPDVSIEVAGRMVPVSLTAHPNGQWVKKHEGKQHRFGAWRDAAGTDGHELARRALARFRAEWRYIVRGMTPTRDIRPSLGTATVELVCDRWMRAQRDLHEAGKLSPHTLRKYAAHANAFALMAGYETVVETMGQAEFRALAGKIAKRFAVPAQGDILSRVRAILAWAEDEGLIERMPKVGRDFRGPSAKVKRAHQQATGSKALDRLLIRVMIAFAPPDFAPVILLGINAGFGEEDCRKLRREHIHDGLLDTTRNKTGELRIVPLWPETLAALEAAWDSRGRLVNRDGYVWPNGAISKRWRAFKREIGIGDPGDHYWLRHTLRTVGGRCDRDGVRYIMGQKVGDLMDATYDHDHEARVEKARRVSDHVRAWLYAE